MAAAQSLAVGVMASAVLMAGAGAWLWHRRRLRRQQRQNSWRELCLRLELVPRPERPQVATGELQETAFHLHDTGSTWLVELPLAQPLLPPGMLLLSPDAPSLPPHLHLRPLTWESTSPPSGLEAWSVEGQELSGKVEAPQAFLDEAARAMQAHAPLRVEPRRFIQALRAGSLLSVNEARDAVRALHATARRWREVAEQHGLPRVQPLPEPEPVPEPPSAQEVQAPPPPKPAPPPPQAPKGRRPRKQRRVRRASLHEHVVDFNALPRLTRERFVQVTRPQPAPEVAPLLADLHFRGHWLWTWLIAGIGAFSLYSLYHLATDYRSFGVVQGTWALGLYALCVFCVLAAVLMVLFHGKWRRQVPFHPGRYVLPLDFVDATTQYLRIIPLKALDPLHFQIQHFTSSHSPTYDSSHPYYSHTRVTLRFKDRAHAEEFLIQDRELAEAQTQRLSTVCHSLMSGQEPKRQDLLRQQDPFYEARDPSGGFESLQNEAPTADSGEGPLAHELPWQLRPAFLFGLACLASLVLGPTLWRVRNHSCDEAAYAEALQDPSGEKLRWYASSGGRHSEQVYGLGAERAFQNCEKNDTEACWTEFLWQWPRSPRRKEVERERRPRAALEATPRTVAALKEFLKRYPSSGVSAEVRERLLPMAEIQEQPAHTVTEPSHIRSRHPRSPRLKALTEAQHHELFATAQAELQKQGSRQNPEAVLFLSHLLTYLESSESTLVHVRFRRQVAPALSGPWGAVNTGLLEGRTVKALGSMFRQVLPDSGILTLVHGESLPEQPEDTEVKQPRIDIRYTISKSARASPRFDFDVALRRPGAQPVRIRYQVTPPKDDLPVSGSGTAPSDSAVHDDMAEHAFEELNQKLGSVFFREDSRAFQALHP